MGHEFIVTCKFMFINQLDTFESPIYFHILHPTARKKYSYA